LAQGHTGSSLQLEVPAECQSPAVVVPIGTMEGTAQDQAGGVGGQQFFSIDDLFQHRGADHPYIVRQHAPEAFGFFEDDDDSEEEAVQGEVIEVADGEEGVVDFDEDATAHVAREPPAPKPQALSEPVAARREDTNDSLGSIGSSPPSRMKPKQPHPPEAPGDETMPEEGPMVEEYSTTSRPSRLSRWSSTLSNSSTLSRLKRNLLRSQSTNSMNSMSGKDRVVRKYQFSANGIMHHLNVSHSKGIFYIVLDNKLVAFKQHGSQTYRNEAYELDFLVPSGSTGWHVAWPGKLTVKWRVAAGKWRYEMVVAGKTLPCLWKNGKETDKVWVWVC